MRTHTPARRLRPGSTIGIFTPSEPLTAERVERVRSGAEILVRAGFKVQFSQHWRERSAYSAGSIDQRLSDINELLNDDKVDALVAAWGGKSASQLLTGLDFELIRNKAKPICAFSDGCAILNAVTGSTGLVTFYGPNVVGKLDESAYSDLNALMKGGLSAGSTISLANSGTRVLQPGDAEGILIGGNLNSYLNMLSGSAFEPISSDCLLFFESGQKTAQAYDLLFTALRNSRHYSSIRGLILGDLPLSDDPKWGSRAIPDIVSDIFDNAFPILHAPIFGHRKLPNPVFPIGCRAVLSTKEANLALIDNPTID